MATWDTARVKSQIRLAAYRLARLQERHDQSSNITKRDIATLIGQGNIETARQKVERLIRDDRLSALIEGLEMYCNVLLERFTELGQAIDFETKSPVLEAVCGIILAAPRTEIKDLIALRDMLVQQYGPEFTSLAMQNYGHHVPLQMVDTLSKRPPPSAQVDAYMASIAKAYQLSWTPPLLPHQKAHALSGILDQTAYPRVVDLEEVRQLCTRGIPPQPPWLRPRIWKLLFGTIPAQKDAWETEAHSKRQSYYELTRRLLDSILLLPPPTTPPTSLDMSLLNLTKSMHPLPHDLDEPLEASPLCPLDDIAPAGLRIETADAVDQRLYAIQSHVAGANDHVNVPEIRLDGPQTPQISVSSPADSPQEGNASKPGTMVHSPVATRKHSTVLLRLMYIHMTLHPSTPTLYLASLLVPLYIVMVREIEPTELAHVEADTFWLLAELWGEMGELMEEEGTQQWVVKFGQRLAWADSELWQDLHHKGLDPAFPHYSYRWLAPLLTRTLSHPCVLIVWDSLFTRTSRTSDYNAKLEFLLDICTGMLIHARARLFRLGKAPPKSPGLWGDIDMTAAPPPPTPTETEEGFVQGMSFLQSYPMEELGGPERVIDIAMGLDNRRRQAASANTSTTTLTEKLRGTMWTDLIRRTGPVVTSIPEADESDGTPSPDWPDSGAEDEGDATVTARGALLGKLGNTVLRGFTNQSSMGASSPLPPASPAPESPAKSLNALPGVNAESTPGIGSRLGNSIWRGLTNQSAMEDPPSPPSPPSPVRSEGDDITSPRSPFGLRSYTERLRDSDAAAAWAKASSNWTAKAANLWGRSNPSSTVSSPDQPTYRLRPDSLNMSGRSWTEMFPKRGSLPSDYNKEYSPPPRPNFRESRYFSPGESSAPDSPRRTALGLASPPDFLSKSKSALASLTGSTQVQAPAPKAGPRPLLLNSSSLITPSNTNRLSRSPTPIRRSPQPQRDSVSSISSIPTSLSGVRQSTNSDRDSESGSGSRIVPLRREVSPRASPSARAGVARPTVSTSGSRHLSPGNESEPSYDARGLNLVRNVERRTSSEESVRRGWGRVDLPDSPATLPSSPPPKTPITFATSANIRVNGGTERQHGSMVLNEPGDSIQTPLAGGRMARKKSWGTVVTPSTGQLEDASDSSTSQGDGSQPRATKRYQRPANLRIRADHDSHRSAVVDQISPGGSATLVPESFPDPALATTPRATDFTSANSPIRPSRVRRSSRSPRRPIRKTEEDLEKTSGGEEGDDEGYDEFLSAYESEDNRGQASVVA